MLVDKVKGKPRNFEASLNGSLYSTFTTSFYPYAFYNKQLQTFFKDQLDLSKATCSFMHRTVYIIQRVVTWGGGGNTVGTSFLLSCDNSTPLSVQTNKTQPRLAPCFFVYQKNSFLSRNSLNTQLCFNWD